ARDDELLEEHVRADAHALLQVRHLGLRLRGPLRGVHQPEDRASDRDHDRGGDQQLRECVAGLSAHDAFLVFTLMRSASPAIRVRVYTDATRACSLVTGVTRTWRTKVLFGFVGSG